MCKPCVGDHVVLADRADARPSDGVRIFVSDPLSFKVGTHYRFIVEGRGPSHPSEYFGTIAPDAAPP